jgi:hypothetical protein
MVRWEGDNICLWIVFVNFHKGRVTMCLSTSPTQRYGYRCAA